MLHEQVRTGTLEHQCCVCLRVVMCVGVETPNPAYFRLIHTEQDFQLNQSIYVSINRLEEAFRFYPQGRDLIVKISLIEVNLQPNRVCCNLPGALERAVLEINKEQIVQIEFVAL